MTVEQIVDRVMDKWPRYARGYGLTDESCKENLRAILTQELSRNDIPISPRPLTSTMVELLKHLRKRSFKTDSPHHSPLSDYFLDLKLASMGSKGADLIGRVMFELIGGINFYGIGGPQVGAVPIAMATVSEYRQHQMYLEGFYVRDKTTDHGTQKLLVGNIEPGERVVIVDDVVTKGNATLRAVQAARDHGCVVVMVVALVDRLEGAAELFAKNGVAEYKSVFTIDHFKAGDPVSGG